MDKPYSLPTLAGIVNDYLGRGVSHTPSSDEECVKGAFRRARDAMKIAKVDLGIGMKGGIVKRLDRCFLTGWCFVVDKNSDVSMGVRRWGRVAAKDFGKSLRGGELGSVIDRIMGVKDTKRKMGAIWMLARGLTNRQEAWEKHLFTLWREC